MDLYDVLDVSAAIDEMKSKGWIVGHGDEGEPDFHYDLNSEAQMYLTILLGCLSENAARLMFLSGRILMGTASEQMANEFFMDDEDMPTDLSHLN